MNIIILASGFSKRFNGNKLLHLVDNKPMAEYSLILSSNLRKINKNINDIVIVSKYEEIKNLANKYDIRYIQNDNSDIGISNSIKLGILNTIESDYLFMVADEPYLDINTINDYINEYYLSGKSFATLIDEDNNYANPCIFSLKYKEDLLSLSGDKGGRCIINKHLEDTYIKKVLNKEVKDIDFNTL